MHPVLIKLPAEVGMHHHHTDAAYGTRARQENTVGLGGQRIASRERMFSDKGPDRLAAPNAPNAICEVENPGNLAAETVDFQCNAAHGRVAGRSLDLGCNSFITGLA